MRDLNELRRKAEAARDEWETVHPMAAQRIIVGIGTDISHRLHCAPDAVREYAASARPTAILALLDRLARAEADAGGWARLVGEMLAAVPLGDVLKAGATGADFVSYVRGCAAENARLRGLLAEAGKALEPFASGADRMDISVSIRKYGMRADYSELSAARTVATKIEEALK